MSTQPGVAETHNALGLALKARGHPSEAILHHQAALRLGAGRREYYASFAKCMDGIPVTKASPALVEDLVATFAVDGADHQALAFACTHILKNTAAFQVLLDFVDGHSDVPDLDRLMTAGLDSLHKHPLLLALLGKAVVRDAELERVLTATRHALLRHAVRSRRPLDPAPDLVAFTSALALQCFANEYVYFLSPEESAMLPGLAGSDVFTPDLDRDQRLAVLACYVPLGRLDVGQNLAELARRDEDSLLAVLITRQVLDFHEERRLRSTIPVVGEIEDRTSRRVREQYEENPYPRWLSCPQSEKSSLRGVVEKALPDLSPDELPEASGAEVLIAGCGTGRHALARAAGLRRSRVIGADLSLSSLCYAKRKAAEMGVENLELRHGDLMSLHLLERAFDLIECIGVLHHMADPEEGWAALANLAKPGGLMRVGLYSKAARKGVVAAQSWVADRGYAASPEGIRRCRQDILAMPDDSPVGEMRRVVDFYSLSETRDLLFPVREVRFTLREIGRIIDRLGLRFLGLELHDSVRKRYLAEFPEDPWGTSLDNWHRFERRHEHLSPGLYLLWVQRPARKSHEEQTDGSR